VAEITSCTRIPTVDPAASDARRPRLRADRRASPLHVGHPASGAFGRVVTGALGESPRIDEVLGLRAVPDGLLPSLRVDARRRLLDGDGRAGGWSAALAPDAPWSR
jgi:hypothetical protein